MVIKKVYIMKKHPQRRNVKTARAIFLLFLLSIFIPTNYLGKTITTKHILNSLLNNVKILPHAPYTTTTTTATEKAQIRGYSTNAGEKACFTIWAVFILLTSSTLLLVILNYLQTQPLHRQCLLLHLYEDVVKRIFARIWVLPCIAGNYMLDGYEVANKRHMAKIIA